MSGVLVLFSIVLLARTPNRPHMATLRLDQIAVPLRAFRLELSLEVDGDGRPRRPVGRREDDRPARGRRARAPAVGPHRARRRGLVRRRTGRDLAPPERRRVGLVFQDYALFPHLTVRQNVEYARRHAGRRLPRAVRGSGTSRPRVPTELSGGERAARRARARARPRPRGAAARRAALGARRAHEDRRCAPSSTSCSTELDIPVLLVTHDFEDAAALADRVGVIVDGDAPPDRHARASWSPVRPTRSSPPSPARTSCAAGPSRPAPEPAPPASGSTTAPSSRPPIRRTAPVVLAVYPWDITSRRHAPARLGAERHPRARSAASPSSETASALTVGPISAEITAESLRPPRARARRGRLRVVQGDRHQDRLRARARGGRRPQRPAVTPHALDTAWTRPRPCRSSRALSPDPGRAGAPAPLRQ